MNESFFHAEQVPYYETIMTIGNGYLGTRGSFAESYARELPSTLVHGVFNHHPSDQVPDLANVPAWYAVKLTVDGEVFKLDQGTILGYRRWLDMRMGTLNRQILWESHAGKIIRVEFSRLASMDNQHLLLQQIKLTALDDMEIKCALFFDYENAFNVAYAEEGARRVSHWTDVQNGNDYWQGTTNQSGYVVALTHHIDVDQSLESYAEGDNRGQQFTASLKNGESLDVKRYVTIASSRDSGKVADYARQQLSEAVNTGYLDLEARNAAVWQDLWSDMDVVIKGDELAQLAIRFVTYHLLIAAPRHDEHVSIGAKTLSGFGYKGHVFWDTELFMLPPFTFSRPKIARNLLMYRYHNLAGAREKAAEAGYRGAMFPWESTDTGRETTPRWTLPGKDGNRIRIWTGDHEQHISSDIAYAVWQFWQWTGDNDFFANYGAELILDTAIFWESRVEWNEAQQRYELHEQIGPDEFHENVDNPVFTNRLTIWHMQHAIRTMQWLQQHAPEKAAALATQLGISDDNLSQWQHIADHMYIPRYGELKVYEQFDGYFERNYVHVPTYSPRSGNIDVILGHRRTNESQVIKQADVVMLMALLAEEMGDKEELLRNWRTYLPRTAHDSSLSPAIHAWVGARLGLVDEAYELWMKGAGLDLENNKGNVRDGIHAAACGGLRQAVLLGFAGLHLSGNGWAVRPQLPEWWRSVSFTIYYRGRRQPIIINND
ncbi:MAG: glycoside hydrolase family 65 protein [Chloroflexi bacterium]|nr:glycoside hydrolase family 65 protein [Chloroflexota bacterium]